MRPVVNLIVAAVETCPTTAKYRGTEGGSPFIPRFKIYSHNAVRPTAMTQFEITRWTFLDGRRSDASFEKLRAIRRVGLTM